MLIVSHLESIQRRISSSGGCTFVCQHMSSNKTFETVNIWQATEMGTRERKFIIIYILCRLFVCILFVSFLFFVYLLFYFLSFGFVFLIYNFF